MTLRLLVLLMLAVATRAADGQPLLERAEPHDWRLNMIVSPWTENALLDTRPGTADDDRLVWIPVDPLRIRDRNEQRSGLDRPWDGFGTGTHLDEIVPLSFLLHPPLDGAISFRIKGDERNVIGVDGVSLTLLPSLWGVRSPAGSVSPMRQWIRISPTSIASNDRRGRPEDSE
ncbi:MAG: hypothetical protein AAGF47_09800 [Planctomycetota bacterium]